MCFWVRESVRLKKYCENSFSIYEIAKYAFCPERDGKISESDIPKGTLLRLIPCVTEGRRIPGDIVTALCVLPPSVGVDTLSHPPHGGCGLK